MAKTERIAEWDLVLREGLNSYSAMGSRVGTSGETFRKYTVATNQTAIYKAAKQEAKQAAADAKWYTDRGIDLSLRDQLTGHELWGFNKAVEFYESKKGANRDFTILRNLFTDYQTARRSNRKTTLEQLGGPHGLVPADVTQILSYMELPKLGRKLEPQVRLTQGQMDGLDRAVNFPMPDQDKSFFLGIKLHMAGQYYARNWTRYWQSEPAARFGNTTLSYRIASQVYQRQYDNFTLPGISRSLKISPEIRDHALDHKREISPVIKEALKLLHDRKTVRHPWVYW